MSEIEKYEYGSYTLAQCCTTCNYAHNPYNFKIDICPECGGDVEVERGRWKQALTRNNWFVAYVLEQGRWSKRNVEFLKKKDEKLPTGAPENKWIMS